MKLGDYIKEASGKAFTWGAHDCSTFGADWLVANGRDDPMADVRGQYHDEESALDYIEQGGGLVKLWTDRMPAPCKNPSAGAVGIAYVYGEYIVGIYSGERWVFLMKSGIKGAKIPDEKIVRAWSLG